MFPSCINSLLIDCNNFVSARSAANLSLLPELAEFAAAVDDWSRWVAAFRYPGGTEPEPDDDELRRALDVIDRLTASLRAKRP